MSRGHLALVFVLLAALSIAPVGAATVAPTPPAPPSTQDGDPAQPSIDAAINGQSISDDGFQVVFDGARLQLDVSMPDSNVTLDTVLVRVNGRTVVDRSDPGASISLNRSLPIGGGNNTVRVVAEGSNDVVRSMQFRVYLESVPPALDLESPIDTLPEPYQYPDLVVERTDIRLQGQFNDFSGFEVATFDISLPGHSTEYRTFTVQGSRTFDEQVLLQYGRNTVQLETRDVVGNSYFNTFSIRVVDRDAPDLDLDFESQQERRPRYNVTGDVTDSVWVRNVSVKVYHYSHGPFEPAQSNYMAVSDRQYRERSRDRLAASFRQSVRLIEGQNLVVVQAHDAAGHTTVRRFFINYEPDEELPPTISLIRNQTVVRSDTGLDLTALVSDGDRDLSRVIVEAQNLESRTVTDVETLRPEDNATYLLERTLNISAGVNQIDIVAFDERGDRSERRFFVDTEQRRPLAEPPGGYEQIADSETDESGSTVTEASTPAVTTETRTAVSTTDPNPQTPSSTATEASGSGGEGTSPSEGTTAESDDSEQSEGGLLGGIPLLPVLGVVVVVFVGGFLGYRRVMRV